MWIALASSSRCQRPATLASCSLGSFGCKQLRLTGIEPDLSGRHCTAVSPTAAVSTLIQIGTFSPAAVTGTVLAKPSVTSEPAQDCGACRPSWCAPTGPVTFQVGLTIVFVLAAGNEVTRQPPFHDSSIGLGSLSPVSEGFVGDPWLSVLLTLCHMLHSGSHRLVLDYLIKCYQ
jgi:hypothetical protein